MKTTLHRQATVGLALLALAAPALAEEETTTPPTNNPVFSTEVEGVTDVAEPPKGQAGATGFVEGQSLTLSTRNFYAREHTEDSFAFRIPKDGGSERTHARKTWVQGTILKYSSGYTQGTVGFGLDVGAFSAINLGARQGPHRRRRQPDPGGQQRPWRGRVVEAGHRRRPPACLQHRAEGRPLLVDTRRCSATSTTAPCPPASPARR